MGERLFTHSSIALFQRCPRQYHYRYREEIIKPWATPGARGFGSVIHDCLELCLGGKPYEQVQAHIVENGGRPDQWLQQLAMMDSYYYHHPLEHEPWEVVSLEDVFHIEENGYKHAGKIDGLVRMKDTGQLYLLEHKTAGKVSQTYKERIWHDQQIHRYARWYGKAKGIQIEGVVYNVLIKIARRRRVKRNEEDEAYLARLIADYRELQPFLRINIPVHGDTMKATEEHDAMILEMMAKCEEKDVWPKATGQCEAFHRPCDYLKLCIEHDSPYVREAIYEHKEPHSELK